MSKESRRRASLLSESRDALAEWKETRDPTAARRYIEAQRRYGQETFNRAIDEAHGQLEDEKAGREANLRRYKLTITEKPQKEEDHGG